MPKISALPNAGISRPSISVPPAFPLADSFKFEIFSLVSKICAAYRFSKLALRTEPPL